MTDPGVGEDGGAGRDPRPTGAIADPGGGRDRTSIAERAARRDRIESTPGDR